MKTVRVIDSSIVAKYILKEEGWKRAGEVLREKPYTLELALKEAANALWKRVTLRGDISADKALVLLKDLLRLKRLLRLEPQDGYIEEAFKIAVKHRLAIYDALFISQAKAKNAILTTSDEKQYKVARSIGVQAELIE